MANGRQKAEQNVKDFEVWASSQSDESFTQIIFRGQLNRGEVAKGVGCGKSALVQNPAIRQKLEALENLLRERGVLPQLINDARTLSNRSKEYNNKSSQGVQDSKRVSQLEQENITLRIRNGKLESQLERFVELSEALADWGMMPPNGR